MDGRSPRFSRRSLLLGAALAPWMTGAARAGTPGPAFSLVDQEGRPVTERTLTGKPVLLHFGFTRCPVICPTTLYELSQRMQEMGALADALHVVFVTVDPAHDTPAILKEYAGSFDERILALGGDQSAVDGLVRDLGGAVVRRTDDNGDTTFDHPYTGYTFDRRWQRLGSLFTGADSDAGAVTRALQALALSA